MPEKLYVNWESDHRVPDPPDNLLELNTHKALECLQQYFAGIESLPKELILEADLQRYERLFRELGINQDPLVEVAGKSAREIIVLKRHLREIVNRGVHLHFTSQLVMLRLSRDAKSTKVNKIQESNSTHSDSFNQARNMGVNLNLFDNTQLISSVDWLFLFGLCSNLNGYNEMGCIGIDTVPATMMDKFEHSQKIFRELEWIGKLFNHDFPIHNMYLPRSSNLVESMAGHYSQKAQSIIDEFNKSPRRMPGAFQGEFFSIALQRTIADEVFHGNPAVLRLLRLKTMQYIKMLHEAKGELTTIFGRVPARLVCEYFEKAYAFCFFRIIRLQDFLSTKDNNETDNFIIPKGFFDSIRRLSSKFLPPKIENKYLQYQDQRLAGVYSLHECLEGLDVMAQRAPTVMEWIDLFQQDNKDRGAQVRQNVLRNEIKRWDIPEGLFMHIFMNLISRKHALLSSNSIVNSMQGLGDALKEHKNIDKFNELILNSANWNELTSDPVIGQYISIFLSGAYAREWSTRYIEISSPKLVTTELQSSYNVFLDTLLSYVSQEALGREIAWRLSYDVATKLTEMFDIDADLLGEEYAVYDVLVEILQLPPISEYLYEELITNKNYGNIFSKKEKERWEPGIEFVYNELATRIDMSRFKKKSLVDKT